MRFTAEHRGAEHRGAERHHVRGRRRGAALVEAIHRAVLEELAEHGYAELTMESVATRARAGKTSIYRRWQTKRDLVLDVLFAASPSMVADATGVCDFTTIPPDLDLKGSLAAIGRKFADYVHSSAEAIRAVGCEASRDPELARLLNEKLHQRWHIAIVEILQAGRLRGEIATDVDLELIADILPALVTYRTFVQTREVNDAEIIELVTTILLPLTKPQLTTSLN